MTSCFSLNGHESQYVAASPQCILLGSQLVISENLSLHGFFLHFLVIQCVLPSSSSTLDGSSTVELMHIKDMKGPGPAEHIPNTSTKAWR
jgi:hypothetical protein